MLVILPVTLLAPPGLTRLAGLTKPTNTCQVPGPNSWKKGGSPDFTQASMTLLPSMVEVCVQVSVSPAGEVTMMPYLGIEVLDERLAYDSPGYVRRSVGAAEDDANGRRRVETIERIRQQIAIGVLKHRATRGAVASAGFFERDLEATEAVARFGTVDGAVSWAVVLEDEDADLGIRQRLVVDVDRYRCRSRWDAGATDSVT